MGTDLSWPLWPSHPATPIQRPAVEPGKFAGVLGTALLVAMVTAIGTGLGSAVLELFGGGDEEREPVSYSAMSR
jgi:hypothetical protein